MDDDMSDDQYRQQAEHEQQRWEEAHASGDRGITSQQEDQTT